jgi:hypothetical protein
VLAGGPGAEVGTRHQNRTLVERREVQDERGVVAPGGEQSVLETRSGDPLQVYRGDDLVGVDVGPAQGNADPGVGTEGFHGCLLAILGQVGG